MEETRNYEEEIVVDLKELIYIYCLINGKKSFFPYFYVHWPACVQRCFWCRKNSNPKQAFTSIISRMTG